MSNWTFTQEVNRCSLIKANQSIDIVNLKFDLGFLKWKDVQHSVHLVTIIPIYIRLYYDIWQEHITSHIDLRWDNFHAIPQVTHGHSQAGMLASRHTYVFLKSEIVKWLYFFELKFIWRLSYWTLAVYVLFS